MRVKLTIALLYIAVATLAAAQVTLRSVSSVPLPAEVNDKLGAVHVRMGCGDHGSITIPLTHPLADATDPLVRLGPNGAALTRINVDRLAGFEKTLIEEFAPGPNGETYVLARKVLVEEIKQVEQGQVRSIRRKQDRIPTLLRFDSGGRLIGNNLLTVLQNSGGPYRFAVFDSGEILLIDTWAGNRGPDALLLSAEGRLLKKVSLAGSALDESIDARADARDVHYLPVTLVSSRGEVFLVAGEEVPSVAVVSSKGEVLYSSWLKVPQGYSLVTPRITAGHIYAGLEGSPGSGAQPAGPRYGEFDAHSGMLIAQYSAPSFPWIVACSTSNGMSFFHTEDGSATLEIMEAGTDRISRGH